MGFPTPAAPPSPGADLQTFRILLRKDSAGGTDPTVDVELWESGGGSAIATLVSGQTISSESGTVLTLTWDAADLGTADGSIVELRVVGNRSGGNPASRRTVEVGAIAWDVLYEAEGLYYLRARHYDPALGRFTSKDPIDFDQRYAYAGNNPISLVDLLGLACATPPTSSAYIGFDPASPQIYNACGGEGLAFWHPTATPLGALGEFLRNIDYGQLGKDSLAIDANFGPVRHEN